MIGLDAPSIGPRTTFLVTGGADSLVARCVVGLARRFGCRFILLGNQEPDGAPGETDVEATLAAIHEAGGKGVYVRADLTDSAVLAARLREPIAQHGPVTALLHAAGELDRTPQDGHAGEAPAAVFDRVYEARVGSLQTLLACVPPAQLDLLILFSSVAGEVGNAGPAADAVANEMLRTVARHLARTQPTCRVLACDWGAWNDAPAPPGPPHEGRHEGMTLIDSGVQTVIDALTVMPGAVQLLLGAPPSRKAASVEGPLRTFRLRRRLTIEANPFLREQIASGRGTLPLAHLLGWLANAAESLYPGYRAFAISEHVVHDSINLEGTQSDSFVLTLAERRKQGGVVALHGQLGSTDAGGRQRQHAQGSVELRTLLPEPPSLWGGAQPEHDPGDAAALGLPEADGPGPWPPGVEQALDTGPERVTLRCLTSPVSERSQGQFPIQTFDPYLCDLLVQSALAFARHTRGVAGSPACVQRTEVFRAIPPGERFLVTVELRAHGAASLAADVAAHDAAGRVFCRLLGVDIVPDER